MNPLERPRMTEKLNEIIERVRRLAKRAKYEKMAVLIDAEGCIGIRHNGYGYCATVECAMVDREYLDLLNETFGGRITLDHKPTEKTSTAWRWRVSCQKAVACLTKIKPYLRIKKGQAELCLQLQKRIDAKIGRVSGRNRIKFSFLLTPLEKRERHSLYLRCKALNLRGPDPGRELYNKLLEQSETTKTNQLTLAY